MKMVRLILSLILITQAFFSFAQVKKVNNPLQEQEIALLNLISADSINPLNIQLKSTLFSFGLDTKTFKDIALIKKGRNIWIQPLGSGKLYKLEKYKNSYSLLRIDSTIHSGVNYKAFTFQLNDTLFQYGGSGFWHMRGIMTYFSPKTHEWELYPSNAIVNGYDDNLNIIKYKLDTEASKLYMTKSLDYANIPKDFSIKDIDSCYEFDFHKNTWTNLGATNPELIKVLQNANYYNYIINDLLIFQNYLDYYWINFKKNEFGKITPQRNNIMKQPWLSL